MIFAGLPPPVFGALFAVAGAALAALHLVRARRRRIVVPFLPLLRRALEQSPRARRPLQGFRLRQLLSLLLSLAALACITLAAGDPRPSPVPGRTIVLLVDASASMQALDARDGHGAPMSRMARARAEADRIVTGLGVADRASIVRLDAHPAPLGGFTDDAVDLAARVASIDAGEEAADLGAGLRLAADLLRDRPSPTLILIGDGAWPGDVLGRVRRGAAPRGADANAPASGTIDLGAIDLRFVAVGPAGPADDAGDVGITAFAARRVPSHPRDCEVLVELESRGSRAVEVELQILLEGEAVDVERLSLPPHARVQRLLRDVAGQGARLEARVVRAGGPPGAPLDAFGLDDRAFAALPPRRPARVLLVSAGNLFVEGALLADENVQLRRLAPEAWDEAAAARADVVLFDAVTPPRLPAAPALYLDPRGPGSPFAITGTLRDPIVTATAKHPLLRFVSLADLNVASASRFALRPDDVALASSLGAPFFVARDGPRRMAALGFDVRRSDLPLRAGFPVLLVNAIEWLARTGAETGAPMAASTGATVRVPTPEARAIRVRPASGDAPFEVPVADGVARFRAGRTGLYEITEETQSSPDDSPRYLAVNLDPEEIRTPARRAIEIGGPVPGPDASRPTPRRQPWRALLLGALGLLLFEWWAFHRRVTA